MPRLAILWIGAITLLSAAIARAGDENYRPAPGQVYDPATYCQWNRTSLPAKQLRICLDRDKRNPPTLFKARPGESLTVLLKDCKAGVGAACNSDLFQPVWKRVMADNGESTKVDMNSIEALSGSGAIAIVYSYVPNTDYDPSHLSKLTFDCRGHFSELGATSVALDAPPRSIAGRIAALVCPIADGVRARAVQRTEPPPPPPAPSEYCVGFTSEACLRIRQYVDSRLTPSFCRDGFALAGSGLSSEQVRACSIIASRR
jgi:hypothetical protein